MENGCSSNIWSISASKAALSGVKSPAFSTISFDEHGNINALSLPFREESKLKRYRSQYFLRFISNNIIGFKNFKSKNLNKYICELSLNESSFYCKSKVIQKEINDRPYDQDTILGTNGEYYTYTFVDSTVNITSAENPKQNYYSFPFRSSYFDLIALDPINQIVLYQNYDSVVLQDMNNDRILNLWDGYITSISFSENKKYVAFCRSLQSGTNHPNRDKLTIFDLTTKKVISDVTFTCIGEKFAFSSTGEKFATFESYVKPGDSLYSTRLVVFNSLPPYDKKLIDIEEGFGGGIVFSPDDSFVVVSCTSTDICFIDVATGEKFYQLKARRGIENLDFSPDGTYLAASSNIGSISVWAIPPFEPRSNDF